MTLPDPFSPLLHEDLVTPMHHHDEARNHLVVRTPDGPRVMSPQAAAAHVARVRPEPDADEIAERCGWRGSVRRRSVLQGAALGVGALLAESTAPRYAFGATATSRDLLVVVFLRGGADGLSLVPPLADAQYLANRPGIGIRPEAALALDGRYGLNPAMPRAKAMYDAGQLAVVVGAGNPAVTRSHFEDMHSMEWAAPANMRSGWLGRHLATTGGLQGTVRAITRGSQVAMSLSSPDFETTAIAQLASFGLHPTYSTDGVTAPRITSIIDGFYRRAGGEAAATAAATLGSVARLSDLRSAAANRPKAADGYSSAFFDGMRDIASVARSGRGLEVACIDNDDWDMHRGLGVATDAQAWIWRRANDLDRGLDVLRTELGDLWQRTTVVTMSEFGRRVRENGDQGVDHGHGNVMFVAGGGINGGKVYGSIPPLTDTNLVQGDVPITTDYRQVLSELISSRLLNRDGLATIFPGFTPGSPLGIA
ncbi:DUF1501 domain-containing protein [Arsenicicoccus dermatophilus]|uniref:DUF1501 domain-containing protein n=1 Tax=Arsenicicoccus dermatophilus TaxID=1076331 RepID=UPI003916D519